MIIDVEENLIDKSRFSTLIENEIEDLLETNEERNIRADIELLNEMGFDRKMINKVYILLRPENIERAIDYMTEIDGIFQHNFMVSRNSKEESLCFICKKAKQYHLDYMQNNILNEEDDNDNINNEQDIIKINDDLIPENKENEPGECEVCLDEINNEEKKLNELKCGHLFCSNCWFNYLKTLIIEAKVDSIKCMNHKCNENISDEFILKHLSENPDLIEKYKKFKKKSDILKDNSKKICPNPDCDSFLQKSEILKYVKCENGHEYCFECLTPPHGNKPCDYKSEKQFMKWAGNKILKRCPRCRIYTEKNKGCNHMTCVNCNYQWCWLCEGKYIYGHYKSGPCAGKQFSR